MATTPRFGLQSFGGRVPGSFRDNGYAYTLADRQTIDAVLAALESHTHSGGERLGDPGPPTLATFVDPEGRLPGGLTYYYRVSYVDRWGLETAASDEVGITLPAGPGVPAAPILTAGTGGSLGNGGYYYAVAAYVGDTTRQTLASQTSYVNLTGSFTKVDIQMPSLTTGVDGWVVYRRGPLETQLYCLVTVPVATTTYTDMGTIISDCTKTPLTSSTASTNNVVTVSMAEVDQAPVTVGVTAVAIGGGSLAAGTYDYRVRPSVTLSGTTYYGAVTDVSLTVPASSTVRLTVAYSGGEFVGTAPPMVHVEMFGRTAVSYKLMASGDIPSAVGNILLTDNGSGAGGDAYEEILPTWIPPHPDVAMWRIYRSSVSGNYPSASLVHQVVELEAGDAGGNLLDSWDDVGNPLLSGTPRGFSSTLQPSSSLSLTTYAETCMYTPPIGSLLAGPSVSAALDSVSDALDSVGSTPVLPWIWTYTIQPGTGPVTGVARYYPGVPFVVTSVRAALSHPISVTYNVRVDGFSMWGSAQSVSAAGLTLADPTPDAPYDPTSYITVDLSSGTIASGQALVVHVDLQLAE